VICSRPGRRQMARAVFQVFHVFRHRLHRDATSILTEPCLEHRRRLEVFQVFRSNAPSVMPEHTGHRKRPRVFQPPPPPSAQKWAVMREPEHVEHMEHRKYLSSTTTANSAPAIGKSIWTSAPAFVNSKENMQRRTPSSWPGTTRWPRGISSTAGVGHQIAARAARRRSAIPAPSRCSMEIRFTSPHLIASTPITGVGDRRHMLRWLRSAFYHLIGVEPKNDLRSR